MKVISIILVLIIGITTLTMAQEADSIVVTYNNQHIIIPVPALGKQTTIKMADSVQMIEISVSRRNISDISQPAQYPSSISSIETPLKKTKWLSQIEVGFALGIPEASYQSSNGVGNFEGYKIGLTVRDKERGFNTKTAFVSGFKLGYVQLFGNSVIRNNFFQLLFPVGIRYHFSAFNLPAHLNLGANLNCGFSMESLHWEPGNVSRYYSTFIFIQPYLGSEIGKVGLMLAVDKHLFSDMYKSESIPMKSIFTFSLTYRLF